MIRYLALSMTLVALAAPVAAAPAAQHSSRHHSGSTRVTLVPGFSLAFSSSWFGCGSLASRLPGEGDAKTARPQACAKAEQAAPTAKANLFYLNEEARSGIQMLVAFDKGISTEGVMRDLDVELLARMQEGVCREIQKHLPVAGTATNCTTARREAGGHTWIIVGFDLVRADGHPPTPVRQALLPFGEKSLLLQFNVLAGSRAHAQTVIDALLDTAVVDPSAVATAPDEIVTLTTIPGITISAPKGMRACDDATDAQLGNVAGTPLENRDDICTPRDGKGPMAKSTWFTMTDPRPGHALWVAVTRNDGQIITTGDLVDQSLNRMDEINKRGCDAVRQHYAAHDITPTECETTVVMAMGHHALAVHVVIAMPGQAYKIDARSYLVPLPEGQAWIIVSTPVHLQSITRPEADAIVASAAPTQ